jgi:exonuclease III
VVPIMARFNLISYNVKGLREIVKRTTVFNYLKEKVENGIVCLQETR